MKTVRSTTIGIIVCLTAATAFAESIPYQFTTVDIVVPGSSAGLTLQDINDDGVLLTNVRINNLAEAVIANPVGQEEGFRTTTFSCTGVPFADTSASSINGKGQVVGS